MKTLLRLTGAQHALLKAHLFPGDGLEAVAVALCGRRAGPNGHVLTVHQIEPIPYDACYVRETDRLMWPTAPLVPLLDKASRRNLAVLKVHSHPGGYARFSRADDASDRDLFSSVAGWTDDGLPHASAVMLPDGTMFGRTVDGEGQFRALDTIAVAGHDLHFWYGEKAQGDLPEFARKHAQAFGAGTAAMLRRLSVAVVGCSGTGSPVVEQLARLGVGRLVLVDPDRMEERNLNRILNTFAIDAEQRAFKVDVLANAVARMGLDTEVVPLAQSLLCPEAVRAVAGCDLVFGCMDSVEGRHTLNRLAAFYLLPYFDVGVKLVADGQGGIEQNCGSVQYVQPDGSTLLDRGMYTLEEVRAEGLRRTNPQAYADEVRSKYIQGVQEERPAVISVNMLMAALAVNEFLARLHPYRNDPNAEFATYGISLADGYLYRRPDSGTSTLFARYIGRGDMVPLLDMPALSETKVRE